MKIGEVIRTNRKEKQMTQEELASYLGVTASAVNKWENGSSYPDIALLAPIARFFGITTDELLSYREDLTEQEITRIVGELSKRMMENGYEEAFVWVKNRLAEYPNCDKLALNALVLLDSYRMIMNIDNPEQYAPYIRQIRSRLLQSSDPQVVWAAAENEFYDCMNREAYDEAEQALGYISQNANNYRQMRALLYRRKGDCEAAYRTYEEMVLAGYHSVSGAFAGMFSIAFSDGDQEMVDMILEKQEKLAALFEMGRYHEIYLQLEPALERRDKEAALAIIGEIIDSFDRMQDFRKSPLYAHVNFGENGSESTVFMIKQMFQNEEAPEFLKDEPEFKRLMEKLEKM